MSPRIIGTKDAQPDCPIISESATYLFKTISNIASVFIFCIGIFVVAGWSYSVDALKTLYFSPVEMKFNAAAATALLGLSLWFAHTKRASSRTRLISKSCALIAAFIGALTLIEYFFNLDIGIDQALFVDIPDTAITSNAGRMAPFSAVEFVLLGVALFLIDVEVPRGFRPSQFIIIPASLIALTSTFGYVYGFAPLNRPSFYNAMAFHTAIAFLMASIGILTARPDKGIMTFLVKDNLGSVIARRLLIALAITPLLIDAILVSGQLAGLYDINHTSAIDDVLLTLIIIGIIVHTSRYINKLDDMRKKAENELESQARFPRDNPFPVIRIDRNLNVTYINAASKPLLTNLGFQDNGDSLTAAKDKWHDLIIGVLDSRQVKSMEIPINERVFHFTIAPILGENYVNLYGYDITKRKSMEKALDYEKNRLQNIMDSMQDGIYIVSREHKIEYANPVVVNEFGPYEDIKCFSYFHGINGPCPWCKNDVVFQGESVHWEFTLLKTGKTYDIIDTPLTNQDGSISKLEIFRDITNRKKMENDLRLFSKAIEETIDNVHIIDMSGKIIYANKAAAKMTGYSTGEALGMDVVNLVQDRHFAANVIIPTIYVKGYWDGEILCVRKDGTLYHAWLAANLFNDKDDKPIAMIGTLRDITSRKEIEEAYRLAEANMRALMNAITESVCLIDREGVFITVNDTFAKRFSTGTQKEAGDIVGTNFRDILEPDVFETKKGYLDEVISTGLPVTFENTRGESLCLTNMYPVFGDDHKVSGVAIYASDITLRKKYETYLLTSIREKEILMREIHHRVKNNLQIVAGLIGLQLNNITDETYKAMFTETRNRIKSIALVHDKLYRSKGLAEVDFKKYISELSSELFSSFGVDKKCITLVLDMEDIIIDVDIAVPCGLIINELFTNILKYAFPNKMLGEINISVHSDNEGKFEIIISDNGAGFPENIDFRNTKSLGLHIVNILVKQIGGTIELDKTRGSKFTIKFENTIK
ncbi:MAG: PAS domain S-box protein [Nitrospirae bacterium]|nr:PAS domain S-box protein [Nitrospirota bacterium]